MKPFLALVGAFWLATGAWALELTPSALAPERAAAREATFTPWVRVAEEQQQFDLYTAKGLLPLYSERAEGKIRALYIQKPNGCSFWTFAGMDGATFLKRHEKHKKEGFALISCVMTTSPLGSEYWATWVNENSVDEIKRELRKFGVSQASIKK